ncbi:hypothetical protein Hanom_Chr06g00524151 [Helianthus anomalus]
MIRVQNFEYTFRALGMDPVVGDFRRFYQLTVHTGFFSFSQRYGSPKLMTPPKGITKWKKKFFYIKAAAVVARMTFRNVTETIISETIVVPSAKTVEWFSRLWTIEFEKLTNSKLWVLRMMLTRMNRKAKPVVREESEDAAMWRIFDPDFEGKVETVACADDEDGFNITIRDNFRVPTKAALAVELPQGKDIMKKHEPAVVPPLVPQATGISCSRFRIYTDYVVVSDTLEGLGVPGGGVAAGGSSAGSKPADEKKKRKAEEKTASAGERKRSSLQTKRTTVVSQPKPAVVLVVTEPSVQAEDTGKKPADQIFDTVDSSNKEDGVGVLLVTTLRRENR